MMIESETVLIDIEWRQSIRIHHSAFCYITEENVCHIVRDFFVAGTENVAIVLVWLAGYMVQYDDIQQKCRQCLEQVSYKQIHIIYLVFVKQQKQTFILLWVIMVLPFESQYSKSETGRGCSSYRLPIFSP